MNTKSKIIAFSLAGFSLANSASAQSIYLNPTQAATNNALATASSWWTDAAGTTANTTTLTSSTGALLLNFNSLVTSSSGFTGRTGAGLAGSFFISGFVVTDPAGQITVTTASNAVQTVTLAGAVGIDLTSATRDFTFRAGSSTSNTGTLRIGGGTASSWKVPAGRTVTIGTNTNVTAQAAGKTLTLTGDGVTGLGNIVFNGNVGSSSLALAIDGTGTNSSGGNVAFNGTSNGLGSLTVRNATAVFASGSTTPGTTTVNGGGVLALTGSGNATLSGAVTVNGSLRPNTSPLNTTSRFNFSNASNSLTLSSTATTTFDIDGANYTGVTATGATAFNGALAINLVNSLTAGSYSYNLFDFGSQSGAFTSVGITSVGSLSRDGAASGIGTWSGAFGLNTYLFTESDGILGITVSAIPEPSTWAAFAGLSGLAFAAGRRRRRAA
jgi:hypothetical protein